MDLITFSFIKDIMNTVIEAKIEDKEEYLNIKATVIQDNINSNVKLYDRANKIPKKVATPFPPLNFSHIGKICPRKTSNADNWINSGKNCLVIITAIYPLRISRIRVEKAKYLFPALRTLVAPIFPDPTSLISLPLKVLVKIKPKGIDPHKYEKTATKKISIST